MSSKSEAIVSSFNGVANLVRGSHDTHSYLRAIDEVMDRVKTMFKLADGVEEKEALTCALVDFTIGETRNILSQSGELAVYHGEMGVAKLCDSLMRNKNIDKSWISPDLAEALRTGATDLLGKVGGAACNDVASKLIAKAEKLQQYTAGESGRAFLSLPLLGRA